MSDDSRIPDWIYSPGERIRREITQYLLGLIATVLFAITGAIDSAFTAVSDAFLAAGDSLQTAGGAAGEPIMGAVGSVEALIVEVAASLGPLGPIFVAAVGVAIVVVTWRLLIAIADSIPIVQGIVTFLRR